MGLALRKESSSEIYNPYLAARREWDERYGEFITRAQNWRTVAILCALAALFGTAGAVWLAARSRVIPFVVLIDSLGRPVASGLAEQASPGDDRLRRAVIQDWIENLRMVTTDGIAQRRAIHRVYAQIASGSSAQTFIRRLLPERSAVQASADRHSVCRCQIRTADQRPDVRSGLDRDLA